MTNENRNRPGSREQQGAGAARTTMHDRDVATKAVLDNMARLKALRLAREAAEPPRPAAVNRPARAKRAKSDDKAPALAQWLAGQRSGGHRT